MKNSVIRARCSEDLKERVRLAAERTHLEEADIVRLAVIEYLERNEASCGETQQREPSEREKVASALLKLAASLAEQREAGTPTSAEAAGRAKPSLPAKAGKPKRPVQHSNSGSSVGG